MINFFRIDVRTEIMRFWVPFKRNLRRNLQEHTALRLALILSKLRSNGDNEDDINNFELSVRIPKNCLPSLTPRPSPRPRIAYIQKI